ncbi:MAG TPA: PfkB family carbohydrate kinase [Ilumatobacteraceae bacterium]
MLLTVIGDLVEDVVVWTGATVRRGTDNPAAVHRSRGGSAANVAAFAAADVPTRFVGRVGADAAGNALVDALARMGVDVRVQRGGRTGSIVVIVEPDGERTMYPDRGASAELEPVDADWLDGTTLVHVPAYGYASGAGAPAVLSALASARARGAAVSIDASATALVDKVGAGRMRELLALLAPEFVFANADEEAALGLLDAPPSPGSLIVVKDGPRPATLMHADGTTERVPAIEVAGVRDTTGAGDAFAAGFLAASMAGASPREACIAGHGLAARVLRSPGASATPVT